MGSNLFQCDPALPNGAQWGPACYNGTQWDPTLANGIKRGPSQHMYAQLTVLNVLQFVPILTHGTQLISMEPNGAQLC